MHWDCGHGHAGAYVGIACGTLNTQGTAGECTCAEGCEGTVTYSASAVSGGCTKKITTTQSPTTPTDAGASVSPSMQLLVAGLVVAILLQ